MLACGAGCGAVATCRHNEHALSLNGLLQYADAVQGRGAQPMSGSDTGPPFGSPPDASPDCSTLTFDTELASPQPGVVAQLGVGAVLDIALDTSGRHPAIVAQREAVSAGAIIGAHLEALHSCLQRGFNFKADVIAIDGGDVRVTIRPA